MISFVVFPQSLPASMNVNISELVHWTIVNLPIPHNAPYFPTIWSLFQSEIGKFLRRTVHELNSLYWVRLMNSAISEPGLDRQLCHRCQDCSKLKMILTKSSFPLPSHLCSWIFHKVFTLCSNKRFFSVLCFSARSVVF